MDVQQLRSFRSVVATGSVRAAADALDYSPSAISQQVKALERDAGVALVQRAGRGVEPTTAGLALADRIDEILGELGEFDRFVAELRSGSRAAVRVGYFSSLGATWLPRVVGPVLAARPDARLELFVADQFDPARRPRADVQFLVLPRDFVAPSEYRVHPLGSDPYVVALPVGHPLAARDRVALAELAAEQWVDNDFAQGWCRQVIIDACAAAGFQPTYRVQTHDYAAALALVAAGAGITVVPSLGARHVPPGVVTRPVTQPDVVREIALLELRGAAASGVVSDVIAAARRVAAEA